LEHNSGIIFHIFFGTQFRNYLPHFAGRRVVVVAVGVVGVVVVVVVVLVVVVV
jgi:hypothetical protein